MRLTPLQPPSTTPSFCYVFFFAGDADELSFRCGDHIYQIKQIDEGWWLGVSADGQQGLFPANYVELKI